MPTPITFELLNQYFKQGKRNSAYVATLNRDETNIDEKTIIDTYNELRIHANGEYPAAIINRQRPSEPKDVQDYRKEIFQAVTKETVSRIITCLSKIRRSADWSVKYDPKTFNASIAKDEQPDKYFEENFPYFTSVTYWLFSVAMKNYLIDSNAVCAVIPLSFNVADNEYKKPFPYIFNSDQVYEYLDNDYCIIKSKDKATYKATDGKTTMHDGEIWWVFTYERIIKYEQVNSKGDLSAVIDYLHLLGYMPAFKLGGVFVRAIDTTFIYESRIQSIVPRLNKAIREDNDLDVSVVRHLFPEKWEYVSMDCPKCNGIGKITSKTGTSITECKSCHGLGKIVSSPFQSHLVKVGGVGEQTTPMPPAGYITKDVEIIKLQDERIEKHIDKALATINMNFLSNTPLNESGTAKEVDRDELNNFVHAIAEDLVSILDKIYTIGYDYRYSAQSIEDRKAMKPTINVPEKYDMLSVNYLLQEYQTAKTAKLNPVLINKLEEELAVKKFNTDPDVRDELLTILKLDPFSGKSSEDKMTDFQNGFVTKEDAIISANIVSFVRRAKFEDDKFYTLPIDKQKEKMVEFAQEKITVIDEAAQLKAEMFALPGGEPNPLDEPATATA